MKLRFIGTEPASHSLREDQAQVLPTLRREVILRRSCLKTNHPNKPENII